MAHFAKASALDQGSHGLNARPVAIREVNHIDETSLARRRDHPNSVRIVQGERLFAKDVLARLQTLKRERSVKSVRCDIAHRVDSAVHDQFLQAGIGGGDFVLLAEGLGAGRVNVDGSNDLAVLDRLKFLRVVVGHAPGPENAKADGFLAEYAHEEVK